MKPVIANLAKAVSKQPLDWDNPTLVRLQQETRLQLVKDLPTLDLIIAVCEDEGDSLDFMMCLTEIYAQPQQEMQ